MGGAPSRLSPRPSQGHGTLEPFAFAQEKTAQGARNLRTFRVCAGKNTAQEHGTLEPFAFAQEKTPPPAPGAGPPGPGPRGRGPGAEGLTATTRQDIRWAKSQIDINALTDRLSKSYQ